MTEVRAYTATETRAIEEGETKRIAGLTAPYNVETVIGGYFREVLRPGAFTKTLRESDQVALWNHDTGKPLARKSRGTLQINDTQRGLEYDIHLGNQTWAQDAYESAQRGDIQGASFGFRVIKERWEFSDDPNVLDLRELLEVALEEVSPVTFPAYEQTSAEARSIREAAKAKYAPKPVESTRASEPESGAQEPQAAHHSEGTEPDAQHSESERRRRKAKAVLATIKLKEL